MLLRYPHIKSNIDCSGLLGGHPMLPLNECSHRGNNSCNAALQQDVVVTNLLACNFDTV